MQGETKFKLKIRPLLYAIPHSWWVKIQLVSFRGIPDYLGCVNGIFVALELKVDGKDATSLQGHVIRKIIAAGGLGFVVTPELWPDIYEILLDIAKKKRRVSLPRRGYYEKMH